ncbi:cytidine/deoxycytidylate deaminase family protein [Halocella sp. SP3-1]|uniref:deoxycytidylate deaminase n=1 Tax=Halocella sp. SP3-1 TaxID=2382161 RepID=UPI000F75B9CA|nr:cytidine/deoxycytidylate deaminase family protein [Halocella sp. SP3-1]AZO95866.1 cytidine deaminase [Halocella sp. SP3-1]
MERIDKKNYYLDIAEAVLERSTCLRRRYGAVIVNNDEIISTGYNGSPRGCTNCNEKGSCIREELNIPRGTKYELCASVHAEQNALLSASRRETLGADLYLVGKSVKDNNLIENSEPCSLCKKLIINSGIVNVYIRNSRKNYAVISVQSWIDNEELILGIRGY